MSEELYKKWGAVKVPGCRVCLDEADHGGCYGSSFSFFFFFFLFFFKIWVTLTHKQMSVSVIVHGHLSLSRLRWGARGGGDLGPGPGVLARARGGAPGGGPWGDAKLSYLSVEHMSSLRDGSTWIRQ